MHAWYGTHLSELAPKLNLPLLPRPVATLVTLRGNVHGNPALVMHGHMASALLRQTNGEQALAVAVGLGITLAGVHGKYEHWRRYIT